MYSNVPRNNASHGAEAIAEAIQHHQDRLSLNSSKSPFKPSAPFQHAHNPFKPGNPLSVRAPFAHAPDPLQRGNPRSVPFRQSQSNRSDPISSSVAKLSHWAYAGNRPGAGLNAIPGQLAQMFNPTSKTGLANLAGLFAGGPKGDEMGGFDQMGATRVMDKMGMKDQFAPYSIAAHRAAGHLVEHDMQAPQFREGVSNQRFNRNAYKANDFLASKGNVGQGWNPMGPEAIAGFKGASLAQRQALFNMLFGKKSEVFSNFPIPPRP